MQKPETEAYARRLRINAGLLTGCVVMAVVVVIAMIGPAVWGDQAAILGERAAPPSWDHPLGTDAAGHDMLSRSLAATQLTVLLAVGASLIAIVGGVLAGTGVWLLNERARTLFMRVIDGMVAFPGMLLALIIAAVLGAGATSVVVAIGVAGLPYFARLTANLAASLAHSDFIAVARHLGVPRRRILSRHLLPNMAEPLLVLGASNFAQSLTAISALSFVGLGVQSPQYDWGSLLSDALPSLLAGRPAQAIGPTALIVVTGMAAVLIGDGLATAVDPHGARPIAKRRRPTRAETAALATVAPSTSLLDVRDLRVSTAGGKELVHGVSFTVDSGEIVGIVGESGSGKSLTAMTVAQLLPESLHSRATMLSLDGHDLGRKRPAAEMVDAVGVIFQDPGTTFNPALKLGTQLAEVPRRFGGASRAQARTIVRDALASVRITQPGMRMRQYPHTLSGGMRQRAMIASVLSHRPRLIIADEPTTALDVTVQAEILRELRRINVEHRTAMLVISHDIGVVTALCDRVLVMKDGEIVERLPAHQLDLAHASHPYTRRLLAATPSLHRAAVATTEGGDR